MDPKNLKKWAVGDIQDKARARAGLSSDEKSVAADRDRMAKRLQDARAISAEADGLARAGDYKQAMRKYSEAHMKLKTLGGVIDNPAARALAAAIEDKNAKAQKSLKDAEDNPRTRGADGQVRPRLGEESKFSTNRGPRR